MPAHSDAAKNRLYYGDNLTVLRDYIPDASVDLIYLDPPFNSRQDYNVLFAEKDGSRSASQITAFKDTWEWNIESERSYEEVVERGGRVADAMRAFRTLLGGTDMLAYLAMMAPRLIELRRVLKDTGSIYLHCDPTASHYLKLLMDGVFGAVNYRNEIVWRRKGGSALKGMNKFSTATDTILFYSKSVAYKFNQVYMPPDPEYVAEHFTRRDENGRLYQATVMRSPNPRPNLMYDYKGYKTPPKGWAVSLERMKQLDAAGELHFPDSKDKQIYRKIYLDTYPGQPINNLWTDISTLKGTAAEILGYPTQKPEALLERILKAGSDEGDIVLDPFCGCGTAVQVAQKLNRRWIGIDITHLAIGLIKTRLDDSFGPEITKTYDVIGEPVDLAGARQLAADAPFQFQAWSLGLVGARVADSDKRGADRGIDGRKTFHDDNSGKTKEIIFSVKSGKNISVAEVRDLIGVLQREKAEIGVYISIEDPTKPMLREAAEAGFYTSPGADGKPGEKYPRVQLLTIKGLLEHTQHLQRPARYYDTTFRKAPRSRPDAAQNLTLNLTADDEPF
jgi:site-specific DNA-methyltransferase (adenine-specific)